MTPQRREPGIRRRLRIPWVRRVLWERDNPQALCGSPQPTYGHPWTGRNALAKYSPACTTHPNPRYSRKGRVTA